MYLEWGNWEVELIGNNSSFLVDGPLYIFVSFAANSNLSLPPNRGQLTSGTAFVPSIQSLPT